MNAKSNDFARIQEIWDVGRQTKSQIKELGFTKERFLTPPDTADDLIAEGILNRIFRITEEAGKISEEVGQHYGFETHAASGIRNRPAHAYGEIDRKIIWEVIETDLDVLLKACQWFADDYGIDLE